MANFIGTGQDQVPLNQHLGKLAYSNDLPSGNIVGTTDTQTLSNKTLATPNITTGLLLTSSAGTSGQALLSQGSGAAPVWGSAGASTGKAIAMAIVFGG